MRNPDISIVSPVYLAEHTVHVLVEQLIKHVSLVTEYFEIILVEDGSPDRSWEKIVEVSQDNRIVGVKLSRNFGQHNAITAGLTVAKGEWIVVMDCDLQDMPEEIAGLYQKAKEGFDVVFASRTRRTDSWMKRSTSKLFYSIFSYMSGVKHDGTVANFGIYHSRVIKSVLGMGDKVRVLHPMIKWVGYKTTSIPVQHGYRYEGESSYTWRKLIRLAFDISISHSEKPLKIAIKTGLLIAMISLLYALLNIYFYFSGKILVPGYASIIFSIWFLSGLLLFFMGVIGLYIGKIFDNIKGRPIFIIDKILNY